MASLLHKKTVRTQFSESSENHLDLKAPRIWTSSDNSFDVIARALGKTRSIGGFG